MLNEYAPLSITTAQSILYQLHKLPYADVQPLCDELLFALNNPLTLTPTSPQPQQQQQDEPQRPIGFRVEDDDEYEEEDDNNKITCKKKK